MIISFTCNVAECLVRGCVAVALHLVAANVALRSHLCTAENAVPLAGAQDSLVAAVWGHDKLLWEATEQGGRLFLHMVIEPLSPLSPLFPNPQRRRV